MTALKVTSINQIRLLYHLICPGQYGACEWDGHDEGSDEGYLDMVGSLLRLPPCLQNLQKDEGARQASQSYYYVREGSFFMLFFIKVVVAIYLYIENEFFIAYKFHEYFDQESW